MPMSASSTLASRRDRRCARRFVRTARQAPTPASRRWLTRIWPTVHDTEIHLSSAAPGHAPWLASAWDGLQRILRA